MMPNRPEYLAIWLGLTSAGVVVALINTELRGHSLAHCIDIVSPKHVIVAAECAAQFESATAQLMSRPKVWLHGENTSGFERIDHAIAHYSPEPPTLAERRPVTIADRALLIYTSGTTGLPKAANVSHRRLLQWSFWFAGLMNATPHDRMYDCLPLYHSVGGVVATGALLVRGGSVLILVLIRDQFSVRHFWDDVFAGDCTIFQYIGELCRYLVNAPAHPNERAHRPAALLRQRVAGRHLEEVSGPLCHSAHPRVLRVDRRQRVALQRGRKDRLDRPRSAFPRLALSAGAGAIRPGDRTAGARRASVSASAAA